LVLLLDEAIVVLAVGTAAGDLDAFDAVLPEADEMGVEELAAVVWMKLQDGKGETRENALEGVYHGPLAASQDGCTLAPARSDVDEL
jgi:hypothetical protein